jgi:ectoine hydroxylase-related dioxygenase (phytanoyl-CoA dioxygenase family)
VHRKKTKLAARAHRLGTAVERRGIAATYELHDRLLSNRASRRKFAHGRPELDSVQRSIVDALEREGYASVPFTELVTDKTLRQQIEEQAHRFTTETEHALASDGEGLRRRAGKEFVVRLHSYDGNIALDDPWFRACSSHRMLDVANAYLGLWSKLEYLDVWYSIPQAVSSERKASQRWHRDYNDRHLLKAFLYLVDVDEETGPFEYVAGSARGGPYADDWPWRPLSESYPPPDELAQRIPAEAIKTFTAPKGTIIFCNTRGFHRGGFATARPRVLSTVTYSSPASLASLTERNYSFPSGSANGLDAAQRYALS